MKLFTYIILFIFVGTILSNATLLSMNLFNRFKTSNVLFKTKHPRLHSALGHAALGTCAASTWGAYYRMKMDKNTTPAPDAVQKFAQKEFRKIGVKKHIPVRVFSENSKEGACTDGRTIALGYDQSQEIINLLKDNPQSQKLDMVRGALQHEGVHVREQHLQKMSVLMIACTYIFSMDAVAPKITDLNILKKLKKAPLLAFPFQVASVLIPIQLLRIHCERQADEGIENNRKILEAAALDLRQYAKRRYSLKELIKEGQYKAILARLLDSHASPEKRAERFEQRMKELEKLKNDSQ